MKRMMEGRVVGLDAYMHFRIDGEFDNFNMLDFFGKILVFSLNSCMVTPQLTLLLTTDQLMMSEIDQNQSNRYF